MNYDEMPAGREMDAFVAEKVMGQPNIATWGKDAVVKNDNPYFKIDIKPYSTSISAAWGVLEKIRKMSPKVQEVFVEEIEAWAYDYDRSVAVIRSGRGHYPDTMMKIIYPAPLAICRAALKATGSTRVAGENATGEGGEK